MWRVILFIFHTFCWLYRFLCVSALVCIICVWPVIKGSGWLVGHKSSEDFFFFFLRCPLWNFFLCFPFPWGWHTHRWRLQGIWKKVLSLGLLPGRSQRSHQVCRQHLLMLRNSRLSTSSLPLSLHCCCFGSDLWISRTRGMFADINCSPALRHRRYQGDNPGKEVLPRQCQGQSQKGSLFPWPHQDSSALLPTQTTKYRELFFPAEYVSASSYSNWQIGRGFPRSYTLKERLQNLLLLL